jgi:hypothetical protein
MLSALLLHVATIMPLPLFLHRYAFEHAPCPGTPLSATAVTLARVRGTIA